MEKKLKELVDEILDVCIKSHIVENPENLIHVLLAYLRCNNNRTIDDYAANAIVADIIYSITGNIKSDEIKITTSELQRLCQCITVSNIEEQNDSIEK